MQAPLIELTAERGRIKLRLHCLRMGEDLCVTLAGGDKEHIGAVALSQPHTPKQRSTTSSVIAVCGHREDELARRIASQVATHLGVVVCVACGIHVDAILPEELNDVLEMAEELTQRLLDWLSVPEE